MRFIGFISVIILVIFASCSGGNYKHSFNKTNRKYYKFRYSQSIKKPKKVCRTVAKKRTDTKARKVKSNGKDWKNSDVYALAEVDDPSQLTASTKTTPQSAKPVPAKAPKEDYHNKSFEEQTLDERHAIEDEVLVKNNLPKPTSKKHEEIRQLVEKKLKNHKDGDPIKLDPLYFTFDDAEFAVVDMEPFLIAVEYALQGRIILVEGHTDSQGIDDYNVQLSIKRVEKIRQLMHDMGVPDDRISVIGYGEEVAQHDNSSETGRELNRRVDFTVF